MKNKVLMTLALVSSFVIGSASIVLAATPKVRAPCPNILCQLQDPNTIICVFNSGTTCSFTDPDHCRITFC
jgi:hypothetical protein